MFSLGVLLHDQEQQDVYNRLETFDIAKDFAIMQFTLNYSVWLLPLIIPRNYACPMSGCVTGKTKKSKMRKIHPNNTSNQRTSSKRGIIPGERASSTLHSLSLGSSVPSLTNDGVPPLCSLCSDVQKNAMYFPTLSPTPTFGKTSYMPMLPTTIHSTFVGSW